MPLFFWEQTWAPGLCFLLGPRWKLHLASFTQALAAQVQGHSLPMVWGGARTLQTSPGSLKLLFPWPALLWHWAGAGWLARSQEPRGLADMHPPHSCLRRLLPFLPLHKNWAFCPWENGCLYRCWSPAQTEPPEKGFFQRPGVRPESLQVKPGKLISFRLVPSGHLLNFLFIPGPTPSVIIVSVFIAVLDLLLLLGSPHPSKEGEESHMMTQQETMLG